MNMLIFLKVLFCVDIVYSITLTNNSINKSNVLIIFVDDMRHLTEKEVYLPNIQKLARESIQFRNAFAQQSLCAPSRNSILTGRRPDALHLYDFYSYWRDVGNFSTMPQIFKEFGYDTYSVGKVFHPGKSSNFTDDYPYSWTYIPYHPPSEKYKNSAVCKDKKTKRLQKNLICPITVKTQPGSTLPDIETLKYSIDILNQRNRSKPFLLAVGFHKPHIPLKYPHQYLKRVPLSNVTPPNKPYMPIEMPLVAWHPWSDVRHRDDIKALNISFPFGTMPTKWSLKIRQSYYAASLYVDDLIGQLMGHVDNDTIVVLTSDHGWSLGENGLWAKYSNFDVALKVPLIFRIPGFHPKSITTPVELLDIFPTLVDIVGLTIPTHKCRGFNDKSTLCFDGTSLVSLMRNNASTVNKSFAISQYPRPGVYPTINSDKPRLKHIKIMGYSIRTKRYRYTEWISFNNTQFTRNWDEIYGIELYNHILDDEESDNLHLEAKYTHVRQKLSRLLRQHIDPK
ncbi:iduronate 2-sulfatase [Bicyclus anynana]|uniref:Iduronate 2-sulfatase n=1 Tax=Bicyclus anynana TaxID=110368 RepID=A0A6J1MX30_BICAN|nr:iduronate 2-sulfatase [Bicyclus anynana]